jgi:hypothetical protein
MKGEGKMKRMLCACFLVLGLILSLSLVFAGDSKQPKKRWIRFEIDYETGEVLKVKAHSPNPISEKELTQAEIDQLLADQYTYVGKLVFTHSSPGCVTYILGGNAVKVCY